LLTCLQRYVISAKKIIVH